MVVILVVYISDHSTKHDKTPSAHQNNHSIIQNVEKDLQSSRRLAAMKTCQPISGQNLETRFKWHASPGGSRTLSGDLWAET